MGHSVETRENVKNNGIKLWNHLLADTKKIRSFRTFIRYFSLLILIIIFIFFSCFTL